MISLSLLIDRSPELEFGFVPSVPEDADPETKRLASWAMAAMKIFMAESVRRIKLKLPFEQEDMERMVKAMLKAAQIAGDSGSTVPLN